MCMRRGAPRAPDQSLAVGQAAGLAWGDLRLKAGDVQNDMGGGSLGTFVFLFSVLGPIGPPV
jgi:hypothetical protein